MSRLALYLLGAPRVTCDGAPVNVDTRKAVALLAYLAVTRQSQRRDALANLLWSEYDQPHARATLRRTLSALHKTLHGLNGGWLEIERETIGLTPGADLQVDIWQFQQCLAQCRIHGHTPSEVCTACVTPLVEAVGLYHDDFMAGFSLRDSPNFDDWQFFQADSLRRELANALERLVQCYSALADFDTAIAYARRWLALDRLHESAHRTLMQLFSWNGQRMDALHQYQECVQVLDQELGVAPLETTTRLYQAIKENQVIPQPLPLQSPSHVAAEALSARISEGPASAPLPLSSTPVTPPASFSYPLVGRAVEWTILTSTYETSGAGGHVILIEGEAGIGKTRLAQEFLDYMRSKGTHTITAQCYEGETDLAYGPVVMGMRAAIAQEPANDWLRDVALPWLGEASRLLPELALIQPGLPAPPPLDSPGAQSRFFEGLRQVVLAICKSASSLPGLICFDDVQWADSASLDLLSFLVRRLREQPFCLLLTLRSRQGGSHYRLQQLLNEVQRSGQATTVSLSRLSQTTVRELVQAVPIGHPTSPGLVEHLYQETEGLPFFLIEYLTALSKGVLAPDSAAWSLPGGVRDLLRSRLHMVSETGWQLLNTAAIIGRSFDFDTLREASGRSEEETVNALEELIAQGLVEEVRTAGGEQTLTYDFSHEKLRNLVYEETSLARRRLLHRRVAEALVNRARERHEAGALAAQIAYHYRLARNEASAADYYRQAGEHARALYANAEALTHFTMTLSLGHPDTAGLHEAIGDLQTLLGEYGAALKSYEAARALYETDKPEKLTNVEHKLGSVYLRRGEWTLAERHLEAALQALRSSDANAERARLYVDLSLAAHHRAQVGAALELARQALALAEAAHDTRALAQAHNMLGILATSRGDSAEAQYHLERSLALAESLGDPAMRAAALNNLALAYRAQGSLDAALSVAETALVLCIAQGDRHRAAALHNNIADMLHNAGRSDAAMSHLKQAVTIYAEIGVEAGTVQPEIWKLAEW